MKAYKTVSLSNGYGLHTIELYAKNLKYTQVQKVIDFLADRGKIYKMKSDPYNIDRHLKSTYLIEDGIRLRIHQSYNKSSGIGFIINPSTLLSVKYQPIKLWEPTKAGVDLLLAKMDNVLKSIGLDSMRAKDLSLSQMDITRNMRPGKGYDATSVIRCYHKCLIPRHFKVINADDKETKKRLFVIKNDTVTVKLYDKIYELKENGRCPKSLKEGAILRFEVSLKREAFLKKLHLDRNDSLYKMLLTGYEQGTEILEDYDDKILPFSGEFVKYDTAKKRIISSKADDLTKEQMLYLLRKTSDSAGLSAAVRKLKGDYKDVDNRRLKKIFAEFDKLGIAPITYPND